MEHLEKRRGKNTRKRGKILKELETGSAGHVAVALGDIAAQSRDIFCQIMYNERVCRRKIKEEV